MMELKKGDKVILKGFTGIKLGIVTVESATKKSVTILKKNGDEMVFDKKTGKQINVEEGKEKYANSIVEDDGSFVAPSTVGAKRKSSKKVTKTTKAKVEEDDEELEDEDEEDDEEPVPVKKSVKKSKQPAKKSKKVIEEDEDDEFEEVDD